MKSTLCFDLNISFLHSLRHAQEKSVLISMHRDDRVRRRAELGGFDTPPLEWESAVLDFSLVCRSRLRCEATEVTSPSCQSFTIIAPLPHGWPTITSSHGQDCMKVS